MSDDLPGQDDHYYVPGYCVADDPFAQTNGVLINLGNYTDTQSLHAFETDMSIARLVELQEQPVQGAFDLAHLCSIHQRIFQDVYPWAGQLRQVDIGKGETRFLRFHDIETEFAWVVERLNQSDFFADLSHGNLAEFAAEAGIILGSLNLIHPFREGNGRTQREFLAQLAARAGYNIQWAGVSDMAMRHACIDALEDPDCKTLAKLVRLSAERLG